jgi:hypothetical protein
MLREGIWVHVGNMKGLTNNLGEEENEKHFGAIIVSIEDYSRSHTLILMIVDSPCIRG